MFEGNQNEPKLDNSSVERHVSIGDAASILGVSIDTVRRWEKAGKLQAQRLDGKNRYFNTAELKQYKANQPISVTEVAKLLQVSASTVRRLDTEGKLPANRSEKGKRLFDRSEVLAYAKATNEPTTDSKGIVASVVENITEAASEVETALQNELDTFREVEQNETGSLMHASVHLPFSGWKIAFYLMAVSFGVFALLANVKVGPHNSSLIGTLTRSDKAKEQVSPAGSINLQGFTVGEQPGNLVVLPITSSQIKDGSIEGTDVAAGAIGFANLNTDLQQQLGKASEVVISSVPGPVGPQGPAGAQGHQGAQGAQGLQGPAGPGSSITSITAGSGLTGGGNTGAVALALQSCSSVNQILKWNGSAWACDVDNTSSFSGTLAVANGGTGANFFPANGLLYGNGTASLQSTGAGLSGQLILANASGVPTFTTLSGDVTVSATGVTSLKNIVGLTAGTYGSSTQIPQIVIDTTGRITSVTNTTISGVVPGGNAGGDLNGTYPNPSVVKINGSLLGDTTPSSGGILLADGTQWNAAMFTGDVSLDGSGLTTIQANAVSLGADTVGNYVSSITAGTGVSITGVSGEAWSPTIAVLYGSTATTAARGNTALAFTGSGNLTGSVTGTAGGGFSSNTLNVVSNPTFSTVVATTFAGELSGNAATASSAANALLLQGQSGAYYRNASNINTGTLDTARLDSSVTLLGQTIGTTELEDDVVTAVKIADGIVTNSKLSNSSITTSFGTNLNGSASVALGGTLSVNLSASPTFTSINTPSVTNNGTLTVSTTGLGSDIVFNSAGNITLTGFDCTTYDNGGVLTVTASGQLVCDNDDGGAAGTITGSGATNRVPLYTGTQSLGSSWWLQNGSTMQLDNGRDLQLLGGNVVVNGTVTATTLVGSGAAITSLDATNISSGTLNSSRLSANVTLQGNTFNGASQLVQLTAGGAIPALNGSALTSVNAALLGGQNGTYYLNLVNSTGSLSDARLSANVTLAGNSFNGNAQLVQTTIGGLLPALDGSLLTGVNATLLDGQDSAYYLDLGNATGTLNVARITNTSITNAKLQNSSLTVTAGTGLSGGGSVALGASTSLTVQYGVVAGTAVQGNTQITLSPGIGLSGGGTITLGSGGSTTFDLDIDGLTAKSAVNMDDYIAVYDSTTSTVKKISRADWLSGIIGALQYEGTWNAATNTPTLSDGTGSTGAMYAVATGGTVNFGSGPIVLTAGDFVIHNGTVWQKAPSGAAVTSVFGRTSSVVAQAGDYTGSQITYSAGGGISAVNVQAAISELDTEKLASLNGLTSISQTFANDTNVTINSSGSTHTIGWSGQLSAARGGTGIDTSSATGIAVLTSGSWSVASSLNDSQVSDTLTVGASSTVADAALSVNVTKLGASIQNSEVDDNLTISSGGSVADGALSANVTKLGSAIDLETSEVNGNLRADHLQAAATDLGAADVTVDLSNLNGSYNTNLILDGSVTASSFTGSLIGNSSTATTLAANPTDCAANTFAYSIDNSGNLTCSAVNKTSLTNSGSLGFNWGDSEIADTLTLDATSTVADGALSVNVTKLGSSIQNSEVDDDLTISAAGSVADGALSANVTKLGAAIDLSTGEVSGNLKATSLQLSATDLGGADVNINLSNSNGSFSTNLTIDGVLTAASFSGTLSGNATTATALAANPTDCSTNQFATAIAANGNLSCAALTDTDVPDTLTVGASSTVADGALSVNVTKLGSSIQNSEVDDDLTISASGSVADGALSVNVTKLGGTIDLATNEVSGQLKATNLQSAATDLGAANVEIDLSNTNGSFVTNLTVDGTVTASEFSGHLTGDVDGNANSATNFFSNPSDCAANTFASAIALNGDLSCTSVAKTALANSGTLGFTWSDAEVSNTLTASILVGSGSTTNAVDLATAEISGVLADANVADTLTIGASSTVADGALSVNVTKLGSSIQNSEVDDDLTISAAGSVADGALSSNVSKLGALIDLVTEITGNLLATNLQNTPADLGAANVNINLSNSNSSFNTNLTLDGVITANSFSGSLSGNATTATSLATDPTDCGSNTYATTIAANGNLTCASITDAALSANITKLGATITKDEITGTGVLGFTWSDSEVADTLTIGASSTVADGALTTNVTKLGATLTKDEITNSGVLGFTWGDSEVADTLTIGASSTIADGALSTNVTKLGSAIDLATSEVSGQLKATNLQNAGTDLGAANITVNLTNTNGAFVTNITTDGTVTAATFSGALSGNATTATALAADPADCAADTYATTIAASGNLTCSTVTKTGLANSGSLAFTWSDAEVSNTLTASILVGSGSTTNAVDLATAEVAGNLKASNLQNTAADLGAADVTVNLGNTNGSFNTNLVIDGTITTAGNINTTAGALQLNGTDINTAGTLTNVAYKNQSNTFANANTFSAAGTALTVNNNATVSGTLAVGTFDQSASSGTFKTGSGAVSLNGNTSVTGSGTLSVGGLTTLSAGLNVSGTSTFTGNIATSNGNVLIQQAAAGATMILDDSAGKIGSLKAGAAKVAFLFDDSGNFSIGKDNRTNIAAANLAGTDIITILGSSGNVGINDTNPSYALSVGGTFNVAGAATLGSTLNVTGTTTLAALSVGSTLNVTGAATLSSNLSVGGTLNVTGTTTLAAATTTNLTINGGTPILKHLSTLANNLVTANVAAQGCSTYGTITVTGAALGDTVTASPWAQAGGIETTTLTWSAAVSAANTVVIRACNPSFSTAVNTADTQEWRIDIWQH